MKSKKSVARYQRKFNTLRLGYDHLESRHLLAVAAGPELSGFQSTPLDTDQNDFDLQVQIKPDVTPESDLISNLAITIPVEQRDELLREHLQMGEHDSLELTSLNRDELGTSHFKYQQLYRGLAVEGGEYSVHVKDRQVYSLSGEYFDIGEPSIQANVSEGDALNNALEFVGAETYTWDIPEWRGHHDVRDLSKGLGPYQFVPTMAQPSAERVFVATGDSEGVLAYKFDVYALQPLSRAYIFVSAQTGEIIEVQDRIYDADVAADGTSLYNGTVNFLADSFSGGFRLRQQTNGVETYDLNNGTNYNNATDITSTSTSFTATDVQTGVQAHFGAEQTLEYFISQHNRDSYDNNGTTLLSYVSYGTDYVNAFWDGSRMTYGDGNGTTYNPLVSLDIVGHEIAHGVTQNSAGLIYSYESGALNESFSDIFGEAVENFATGTNDWLMGEDIGVNPGSALRSMSDPPAKGDPDTYLGVNWFSGSGDNGGVHVNSGVQNKWFYLLTVGEAGTNDHGQDYDVTGIGITDAGAIAYRNLAVYLTPSSQYIDAREGAIQSAIDLFGEGSQQHQSTIDAWDAVGVGGSFHDLSISSVQGLGTSTYQGTLSDIVIGADLVDTISVELDPNQTLSVAIKGFDGLVPTIEIYDPTSSLIGSGTATGSQLVIQNTAITTPGIYQILVGGDAGSSGAYQLDVLLNASAEVESNGGANNNALADAENINSSAMSVGNDSSIDRLAVVGDLAPDQIFETGEDFETGSLGSDWTTSSSDADGRIVVTDSFGADGSSYSLFMDQTTTGTFNLNEATWILDLSGLTNPMLNFFHAEWGDETHVLPDTFTGSENGDGVAVSPDGLNWFTVLTDTNSPDGVWQEVSIDLAEVASANGFSLGSNFRIKFQQYDNWIYSSDGRAYDQISITTPQASPDWYSFSVAAGQTVSLASVGLAATGTSQIDLRDAGGALLASGVAGANVDSYISKFTNTGATADFYAVVSGTDGLDYNLVVTRGSDFDVEPNDVTGQDILGTGGVFGFVSTVNQAFAEPDTVAAQTIINTTFPGVTLSENVSAGNIFAASASYGPPTGNNVFAPGPTQSNGFRQGDNELRADFAVLQSFVSIDVGSDDASDVAWLRAYDAGGTLLDEVISGSVASGGSETISISRPTADIAYVISAGLGGDITPLDNLVYQLLDPNDDFYTFAAVENEEFGFDAFLPGSGPYLFNNPLDDPGGSNLRLELRDPDGVLVATDPTTISTTALKTGDYELRVYAAQSQGEYFVEYWHNHAPTDIALSTNSISENTNTSGGPVEVGTLSATDLDSTEFTYSLVAGTGDTDNATFAIAGDKLQVKQDVDLDFETQQNYSVRIQVSDGSLTYEEVFVIDVTNQLEVEHLAIDNDNGQRSVVRELVITFDEIVTYSSAAFALVQRDTGDTVTLSDSSTDATGKTVVTLTFSGALVTNGSLNDGNYELSIDGSLIESSATGQLLDGDEDGSEGGAYVYGDREEDKFFRFFGDSDGDRDVDNVDLAKFLQTYRKVSGDDGFNSSLDYDNDGDVDNVDLSRYLMRYFETLPFK